MKPSSIHANMYLTIGDKCALPPLEPPEVAGGALPAARANTAWSLDEDRLIIKSLEFNTPPPKHLVKEYVKVAQTRPTTFNRKPTHAMLSARFEELRDKINDRYTVLVKDLELEIVRGEALTMDAEPDDEPTQPAKLLVTVTSVVHGDEQDFELTKQLVQQNSSVLRKLTIERGNSFELSAADCPHHDEYDILGPEVFFRFETFLQNPGLTAMNTDKEASNQPKPKRQQPTTGSGASRADRMLRMLEEEQEAQEEAIEVERNRERASLMLGLEEALENDTMALRLTHKRQVAFEDEKLNLKYGQVLQEMTEFYNGQRKVLKDLLNKSGAATQELTAKQAAGQAKILREMFEGSMLPRVTALACFLEAPQLKQLCLAQAAACIDQVCEYREWQTDIIPTVCFEHLISMLTNSQVVMLDTRRKCTLPKKTIEKDLQLRQKIVQDELRRMTGAKLRQAAIAPDVAFPHLIRAEIETRRRTYSTVLMDVRSCTPNVQIGDDLLTVSTIEPRLYATSHSTKSFEDSGDGMWYFEVMIKQLPKDGSSFAVGFDITRGAELAEEPTPLPGVTPVDGSSLPCGYVWQSDGILHLAGVTVSTERTFRQGDVVGVTLDQDNALICFYVNGQAPFNALDEKSVSSDYPNQLVLLGEDGIMRVTVVRKEYDLTPAVCMYASSTTVCGVCNFAGAPQAPFVDLPLGNDPLGGTD